MYQGNLLWGAVAGLIGTLIITILMYVLRIAGHKLDLPYLLGTRFVDIENETKVYITGYILHFIAGAAWGAMYVLTITAMGFDPNWATGILWGFAHGIFVGVALSTLADAHPYIGEGKQIADPGMLGHRWSELMPYWILGLHIVFGVITMVAYQLLFSPNRLNYFEMLGP